MIPLILAGVGAYLVGSGLTKKKTDSYNDGGKMAKGGIYSSDDRWVVTFQNQDSGKYEKVVVRANNKKNAIEIAEDESGLGSDWKYSSAEKEMSKGGKMNEGGVLEHGLKKGDEITQLGGYLMIVKNNGKYYKINISQGTRVEVDEMGMESKDYMASGGKMAKGGFFDKKSDVKFQFSENEKIKVLQYDGGKLKKLGATIIEQYAAEQPDGTYYPFYWVVGDWESMEEGKKHPSLYAEDELIERHGNKPNKMASGGMMADGGVIYLESVGTYFRPSDLATSAEKSFSNEGEIVDLADIDNEEWFNALSEKDRATIEKYKAKGGKMAKGGKLVGNQKKLDLNKNGKLDAEDFKMLRENKK